MRLHYVPLFNFQPRFSFFFFCFDNDESNLWVSDLSELHSTSAQTFFFPQDFNEKLKVDATERRANTGRQESTEAEEPDAGGI